MIKNIFQKNIFQKNIFQIIPKPYLIIIIIISIFIIFTLITIYYNKYISENYTEKFLNSNNYQPINITYYKCPDKKIGNILNNVFTNNNISTVSNQTPNNWKLYIPCGYNNVESELLKLKVEDGNSYNLNGDISNDIRYVFGINGCDNIVSKNNIWKILVDCYGRNGAKKLMPETYILYDTNDMEIFKKSYNTNNIYILKKNLQRKEGLKLTNNYNEIISSETLIENYKVVQNYMKDVYLINGRKVNLRVYLLIVIKDGKKQYYLSNLGKCIYTNKLYDDTSFDFESNITSYNLDINIYKKNPRDLTELKIFLDSKQNIAENSSIRKNSQKLFDSINKNITLITKCISNNIYQSDNLLNKNITSFQLFGLDVIFNKNLEPFVLEFNKGPDMNPKDDLDETIKYKIQEDMFKTINIIPSDSSNSFYELI